MGLACASVICGLAPSVKQFFGKMENLCKVRKLAKRNNNVSRSAFITNRPAKSLNRDILSQPAAPTPGGCPQVTIANNAKDFATLLKIIHTQG